MRPTYLVRLRSATTKNNLLFLLSLWVLFFIALALFPVKELLLSSLQLGEWRTFFLTILSAPASFIAERWGFERVVLTGSLVLLSLNVVLFSFYIRRLGSLGGGRQAGLGVFATASIFLSLQCFSCVVIAGVFSLSLVGSLASFLPFGGREFAFFGLTVLALSSVMLFKKTTDPLVC